MKPDIFWINVPSPGRLAIILRPRGGDWLDDEMRQLRREDIDVVVSLLEDHEIAEFGLGNAEEAARKAGVELWRFPIPDRGTPPLDAARTAVERIVSALQDCRNVAVHCRQGIGRSGMMAAATVVRLGETAKFALELVSSARGREVPDTAEQAEWVREFEKHND